MNRRIVLLVFNWLVVQAIDPVLDVKPDTILSSGTIEQYWMNWQEHYGKGYGSSKPSFSFGNNMLGSLLPSEEKRNFIENLYLIKVQNQLHESKMSTFTAGLNYYSDMSFRDVLSKRTGLNLNGQTFGNTGTSFTDTVTSWLSFVNSAVSSNAATATDSVDWNAKGHVSPVKDQGICNSCWAFATTGAVESQYSIKKGLSYVLSEQFLVDCDFLDFGCQGGNPYNALYWAQYYNLTQSKNYGYAGTTNACPATGPPADISVLGYDMETYILNGDENRLKALVRDFGPVPATIQITPMLTLYKSGVFYDPLCDGSVNHAVLITGYGSENGQDYWIVKNSWGTSYGENGFVRVARNRNNHCGIAYYGAVPIIS